MIAMSYDERIEALRQTKMKQTAEKQKLGPMDVDDHGSILPPEDFEFTPLSNHPNGGFFGPEYCGLNFRRMMDLHEPYIDPVSSLAGAWWRLNLWGARGRAEYFWPPEIAPKHLREDQTLYNIISGIGHPQHFAPDLQIGFDLGWGGLLEKVRHYKEVNAPRAQDFYTGLEHIVIATQNFIRRHAEAARLAALTEERPDLRENLETMAEMCGKLVNDPPETFREACQFIAFFEFCVRIYNGSGALGSLDELLRPFYERDVAAGILDDEEAIFHLACLLLKDAHYIQLGGPAPDGTDMTSQVSFLVLEAAHRLKIPTNIAVRVHDGLDPRLYDLAIKYLFEDKVNSPLFIGDKGLLGFTKNGYSKELAWRRVKTGCHWCAIPGREFTLNDIVKINIAKVFDVALREMIADADAENSTEELWRRYEKHMRRAIQVTADGIDYHIEHMHEVFPELALDLFCHGPIEKGLDATHGGVEYYNMCVDASGLATVADSFAAVEQRVEREHRLTWEEMLAHLDNDFEGAEDVRLMLNSIPRYGSGDSRADQYALDVSKLFTRLVKEKPTDAGYNMIPGIFSWASTIGLGQALGATPNGRHAKAPISHNANPDPGFTSDSAPTRLAISVAEVQPGYGNTAPLQLDLDYSLGKTAEDRAKVAALIKAHFDMGGTHININILDKEKLLDAEKHPEKYPDLIVRVTGFSAYFASLSPTFRRWVIERVLEE